MIDNIRSIIKCPSCTSVLFDGIAIKSRVVRLTQNGGEAKCRCKRWVPVPIAYSPISSLNSSLEFLHEAGK